MARLAESQRGDVDCLRVAAARPGRNKIVASVGDLGNWPDGITTKDIKPRKRHQHHYRLRVGRYRVLFDLGTGLRVVSIEEVRKRDERTY
ncbi:cytotoxic translational repressor of toxin-antitoxin stability system [Billgrantia endophytica]|uniref:Cytotoxic translational repressor of toxin-antitoxin stability system n=1 Tax=Billgrantia endophytica TaxID=2033802 RepID=A0A2N7U5T0_9GAMM|nr:cytotoxic translational repressor of toxin-antitoxin stability system [Halomonas endophytica]